MAATLQALGVIALDEGDRSAASALLLESLALQRILGDKGGSVRTLLLLGQLARMQRDEQHAAECDREAQSIWALLGCPPDLRE